MSEANGTSTVPTRATSGGLLKIYEKVVELLELHYQFNPDYAIDCGRWLATEGKGSV